MKRTLLIALTSLIAGFGLNAQVTQINSNKSLNFEYPLTNNKAIFVSNTDSTIWASDGSAGGTIQLSASIKFVGSLGSTTFLNGKMIFSGNTPETGPELYITDGTPGGTVLVADIYPGPEGSSPDEDVAVLNNGFIYFTAERPAEGRELWKTNGTPAGTSLVKDIVPGPLGSNEPGDYELFSAGTYLLFAARTPASGIELWKSDGTEAGTNMFVDINTGHSRADSSNPRAFSRLNNNVVLFAATDATHGEEFWRTDGTVGGTSMISDINPGPGSSTIIDIGFGFSSPVFFDFHIFNNRAYFNAYNGTSAGGLWSTNGTVGNVSMLKDILPGTSPSSNITLFDAINLPNKFIFPVFDEGRSELWQCDGTSGGTVLFKTFSSSTTSPYPVIYVPYGSVDGTVSQQPLFQGSKFFFGAGTTGQGSELWISDGVDSTASHTHMVADINAGAPDGLPSNGFNYCYTSVGLYFPANNGTNGTELWKSDGTAGGTSMVADIVTGGSDSNPLVTFFLINGKIVFTANNGDNDIETDLYSVDGTFLPLPIKLGDFTVVAKSADAILNWRTYQEINNASFTLQRSFDGREFKNIGVVAASGTSNMPHDYSFTDAGIVNSGQDIVYYRLSTTDKDGKSVISQVITLKLKNTGSWNVRLLSNPVLENINVVLSGITGSVRISIVGLNGKQLYKGSISAVNGRISLPAANLPGGSYILLTETNNERKAIQFVK